MTEQTIGPCPGCGVGEYYDHELGRFCNLCGLTADIETWNRLSSQAARIAALMDSGALWQGEWRYPISRRAVKR